MLVGINRHLTHWHSVQCNSTFLKTSVNRRLDGTRASGLPPMLFITMFDSMEHVVRQWEFKACA